MMATFLFLLQLLFIGTQIVPAYTETESCNLLVNASASNFTVLVTPEAYEANTTYQVTISNDRNHTDSRNVTKYLLQALSPQNDSIGEWKVDQEVNCSSINTAELNATQNAMNWTSPNSNITSVEIRVFIVFTNNSVEFKTLSLNKASETTTAPPPTTHHQRPATTPNSISTVQSSSFLVAVVQMPLLLVTSKLLS